MRKSTASPEGKRNPVVRYLIPIVLLALVCLLGFNWRVFTQSPFETEQAIDQAYYACADDNGNYYVLDKALARITCIDEKGMLRYVVEGESEKQNGFFYGTMMAVDAEGNLYVADRRPYDGELPLQILRYDPEGKSTGAIWKAAAGSNASVVAMASQEDGLRFAVNENDAVDVYVWDQTSKLVTMTAQYPMGGLEIVSFAISPTTGTLYYTNAVGDILRMESGENAVVYDGHATVSDPDRSVARAITVGADGALYFVDVGSRSIKRLNDDGSTADVTPGGDPEADITERPIYSTLSVMENGDIVSARSYRLVHGDSEGNLLFTATAAEYTFWQIAFRVALWAMLVILALGVFAFLAVKFSRRARKSMSEMGRLAIAIALFCVLVFVAITTLLMPDISAGNNALIMDNISTTAYMTSALGIGDAISRIDSIDDYEGEDYNFVKAQLDNLLARNEQAQTELYYTVYITDFVQGIILIDSTGDARLFDTVATPFQGSDTQVYNFGQGIQMDYDTVTDTTGVWTFSVAPIKDSTGEVVGAVEIGTNSYRITKRVSDMMTDIILLLVTLVVILYMVFNEGLAFTEFNKRRKEARKTGDALAKEEAGALLLRPLTFLLFTAFSLQSAFVAIWASKLYEPLWNLPQSVAVAIPVSASLLTTSIFGVIGGYVIDKLGARKLLVAGCVIVAAAFASIAVTPSFLMLIVGRLISGVGMGLTAVSLNTLASAGRDEATRSTGFSSYNVGMTSGANIGIVLGAQLVGFLGYSNVYFVAAGLLTLIAVFACVYVSGLVKPEKAEKAEKIKAPKKISTGRFLFSGGIWSFFLCLFLPYTVASYFLYYFFPLYADLQGMTEANIGRFYLLAGLIVVNLGPALTKYMTANFGSKSANVIANVLYALILVGFALFPSMVTAVIAVVLLSCVDSFGFSTQSIYFTGLNLVKRFGTSKAMGIYGMFDSGSQTLAPFAFGAAMMLGTTTGLFAIGAGAVVFLPIYLLLSRKDKKYELPQGGAEETDA